MNHPALFATIWVALGLFVAGEFGKRTLRGQTGVRPGSDHLAFSPRWSDPGLTPFWWASASGLAIAAAHVVIALAINNDWNHAVAWRVTEERTREMLGFGWGGAVAANYVFLAYWAVDLWRWRTNPVALAQQPAIVRWGSRAFVLGIIVPAAIVFAAGPRRWLGVLLVVAMLAAWRPLRSSPDV